MLTTQNNFKKMFTFSKKVDPKILRFIFKSHPKIVKSWGVNFVENHDTLGIYFDINTKTTKVVVAIRQISDEYFNIEIRSQESLTKIRTITNVELSDIVRLVDIISKIKIKPQKTVNKKYLWTNTEV